jgi:hypothetical protein
MNDMQLALRKDEHGFHQKISWSDKVLHGFTLAELVSYVPC